MEFQNLIVDTSTEVATLTLHRPDSLNALTLGMMHELETAATLIAGSDARTVVVSGAGRSFCAGVDITALGELGTASSDEDTYEAFRLGGRMADKLEGLPQVTVAALHGHVVGGGLILAAVCDLRVAASDTMFAIPEIDLGIPYGWGGIDRLVREIGPARTKEYVMTGRPFSADEALAAGFINRVVEPDDVVRVAHSLAATIASKTNVAVKVTKSHVAEVLGGDHSRDDARSAVDALRDAEGAAARSAYLQSND
ncbi:MAG: enoyl-CoA hydratase/isomerase family protein [Actinomycetota bacterium]